MSLESLSRNAQLRSELDIFCPVGHWNLTDDLNNRAPHLEIQSGVRESRNAQIGAKFILTTSVTLTFDAMSPLPLVLKKTQVLTKHGI